MNDTCNPLISLVDRARIEVTTNRLKDENWNQAISHQNSLLKYQMVMKVDVSLEHHSSSFLPCEQMFPEPAESPHRDWLRFFCHEIKMNECYRGADAQWSVLENLLMKDHAGLAEFLHRRHHFHVRTKKYLIQEVDVHVRHGHDRVLRGVLFDEAQNIREAFLQPYRDHMMANVLCGIRLWNSWWNRLPVHFPSLLQLIFRSKFYNRLTTVGKF